MMCLQHDIRIARFAGDPHDISRNLFRPIEPAARGIENPQIDDGGRDIGGAFEPAPDFSSPLHDFADFRCRPAKPVRQRWGEL